MPRFAAKPFGATSWIVVDTLNEDTELFGDQLPNTRAEAESCARAANIAARIVGTEIITRTIQSLQEQLPL